MMHLIISYKEPEELRRSMTTPKQKINRTKAKCFMESTIVILVKFADIQSHNFYFLTDFHWF